ncbi:MAG: GNAT family N-acetyltransferase [Acinetobacter sp.]
MILSATRNDVKNIVHVITLSIQACTLDHQENPEIIQKWLSNKTVENISIWMKNSFAFIYKKEGEVIGFILLSKAGVLLLNYILPDQQGVGIGSALLNQVIDTAKEKSIQKIALESTLTAKEFYLSKKFKIIEEIYENNQLVAYRMERELFS